MIFTESFTKIGLLVSVATWSVLLQKDYRVRVLRIIFVPKRDEMIGEWRKLHNEELR
jgi:hypothetical protein